MGRSSFLKLLVLSMLLVFCFSQGFGRKVMETVEFDESTAQLEELADSSREMIELMDYDLNPKPNTNPKTGYIFAPPPQG